MFDKGDTVWFYHEDLGWRTGIFVGVVEKVKERSKNFGMFKINPNFLERKQILVKPGNVEAVTGTDLLLTKLLE